MEIKLVKKIHFFLSCIRKDFFRFCSAKQISSLMVDEQHLRARYHNKEIQIRWKDLDSVYVEKKTAYLAYSAYSFGRFIKKLLFFSDGKFLYYYDLTPAGRERPEDEKILGIIKNNKDIQVIFGKDYTDIIGLTFILICIVVAIVAR